MEPNRCFRAKVYGLMEPFREGHGEGVHDVSNWEAGITRSCSVSFVPALLLKLVARRHVDYGRTRSMICMSA